MLTSIKGAPTEYGMEPSRLKPFEKLLQNLEGKLMEGQLFRVRYSSELPFTTSVVCVSLNLTTSVVCYNVRSHCIYIPWKVDGCVGRKIYKVWSVDACIFRKVA